MQKQGGINNADLFKDSQRSARTKLEIMGGIQRNPRGILASSPALMQAAAPRPMAPAPMTPPPMMPMVQPALPQVPMQTVVAPMVQQAPVQQQQAPVQQQASMNPMQQAPIKLEEGGSISDFIPKDVTQSPTIAPMTKFQLAMFGLGSDIYEKVLGKYGSEEKAEDEAVKKRDKIKKVVEKTDDPVAIANEVMVASEVEPTDENKKDFAANVFGLENVNDIDAINDRIAKVAIASTIGGGTQGTDKFARAVLLGLQSYKQTATARASGGGSSSFTKDRTALRAYQDTLDSLTRSLNDRDLPEGYTGSVADYASEQALKQVLQTYPIDQIPAQLLNQGGGQPSPQGGSGSSPVINTEEEYNALPSGARYIDDGVEYTKP